MSGNFFTDYDLSYEIGLREYDGLFRFHHGMLESFHSGGYEYCNLYFYIREVMTLCRVHWEDAEFVIQSRGGIDMRIDMDDFYLFTNL